MRKVRGMGKNIGEKAWEKECVVDKRGKGRIELQRKKGEGE